MKIISAALFAVLLTAMVFGAEKMELNTIQKIAVFREITAQADEKYKVGEYEQAARLYRDASAQMPALLYARAPELGYKYSRALAMSGQKDEAVKILTVALRLGFNQFERLDDDSAFATLREDKLFQATVAAGRENDKQKRALLAKAPAAESILLTPKDYETEKEKSFPLLVVMHGLGDDPKRFVEGFRFLTHQGFFVLAPGGSQPIRPDGGAYSWTEDDVTRVRTETESLLKEKRVDPKNVCVLGFSQGGVRAFQAAFKAPHIFNGLICVSGALDDEALGMENLKAGAGIVSTALFHGRGDKLMTCDLAEYAENLLKTANCRVRLLLYEGEHRFPADYQKMFTDALQWIKQADKQPR